MLLRLGLLLFSAWVVAACSGHRSERIKGECVTDVECGSLERCEAEACIPLETTIAIGRVVGAPADAQITEEPGNTASCQPGEGGLVCTVEPGDQAVLVAPEVPGFRFVGWAGAAPCVGEARTLTLTRLAGRTECEARYAQRVRVTGVVADDPGALVLARSDAPAALCADNSCEIDGDATAVLSAPVRPGLQLLGFEGPGCEARVGYRVTVQPRDRDVTCTARYGEALSVRGEARGAMAPIIATSPSEGARCQGPRCEVATGDEVSLRAPELPGFRFRGWSGNALCSSIEQVVRLADLHESAICTGDYVPRFQVAGASEGARAIITVTSADGFAHCTEGMCEVDRGDRVMLMAPSVPGARLRGWVGDGCVASSGASAVVADVARNVRCVAQYEPGVSVSGTVINADAEVTASSAAPRAACTRGTCIIGLGEAVTLVAPTLDRRTFVGWSGDDGCTGTSPTLVLRNVTASKVCRATFLPRHQLGGRAVPPLGGSIVASSAAPTARCEGARCEVDQGAAVALTAAAASNYRFTGWSGGADCMSSQARLELRDARANLTCDAAFATRVVVSGDPMPVEGGAVTASSSSSGASCAGNRCTVDASADVLLRATPSPGFRFASWRGCAEAPPGMINAAMLMLASPTGTRCIATFERIAVTVSASVASGGGGVSVAISQPGGSCTGASCTFTSGGLAVVSARPDPGFEVGSWSCAQGRTTSITLANVLAPLHCILTYERVRHTVRATTQGGGGIEAIMGGAVCMNAVCAVRHGDGLMLRVTTRDEELFDGFTGCATSAPVAVGPGVHTANLANVTASQTCTANIVNRAVVSYASVPATCGTTRATVAPTAPGSQCSGARCLVRPGSAVALDVSPAPNCRFLRWECRGNVLPIPAGSMVQLGGLVSASDVSCTAFFDMTVF